MRVLFTEDEFLLGTVSVDLFEALYPDSEIKWVTNCEEAITELAKGSYDLIISDFLFPGLTGNRNGGVDFYTYAVRTHPEIPFYFVTGTRSMTVEAITPLPEYDIAPPVKVFDKVGGLRNAVEHFQKTFPAKPANATQTGKPAEPHA